MNRQTFSKRLHAAATSACDFARNFVEEGLPDAIVFRVRLNRSYDGHPLRPDERVYPEDSSYDMEHELHECAEDIVVSALWREGAVPEWVNVSVIGETETATLVEVLACGRFTANDALLYHEQEGIPPFHVLGPAFPVQYQEEGRFSVYHHSECWRVREFQQLARHSDRIWSLELVGDEFDDRALSVLPELPVLEILELRHSPIGGSGLATLSRYPKLRVLRIALKGQKSFGVDDLPVLSGLQAVDLVGIPSCPWGFDELAVMTPQVDSLTLQAEGELVVDGYCPRDASRLAITASKLAGALVLPKCLSDFSFHVPGGSALEVERLLATVEDLRYLSLSGTPIDEAFVLRCTARFQLAYLEIVDTGLDVDAVRRIAEAHPKMRLRPFPTAVSLDRRQEC